jgi:hypothetical protein
LKLDPSRQPESLDLVLGFRSFVADLEVLEPQNPPRSGESHFSFDQEYLMEKVNREAEKPLTYGGLAKLNAEFGTTEVTEALRDCVLVGEILAPYAYAYRICRSHS